IPKQFRRPLLFWSAATRRRFCSRPRISIHLGSPLSSILQPDRVGLIIAPGSRPFHPDFRMRRLRAVLPPARCAVSLLAYRAGPGPQVLPRLCLRSARRRIEVPLLVTTPSPKRRISAFETGGRGGYNHTRVASPTMLW